MWNEPAAANWAHFALTLVSLRGEPITTSLLQSRAKITEIPSSSPERRGRAVRKMPTPRFLIRLALQTLVEITHALHSLPANDSSSLRDQAERGKWGRRQKMEVEGYGKRNIDGSKMLTSIIADSKTCPSWCDFQTGTLNIGDMEISDTAGYSILAGGLGAAWHWELNCPRTCADLRFDWATQNFECEKLYRLHLPTIHNMISGFFFLQLDLQPLLHIKSEPF